MYDGELKSTLVGMALSPNEGLKRYFLGAVQRALEVGMALSPNEGLKQN